MDERTRRITERFPTFVTALNILIPEINIQHGERKIDIRLKTLDKNGNEKFVDQDTDEAKEIFNNAVNRTFKNADGSIKDSSNINDVSR